jgi:hypothetical protein
MQRNYQHILEELMRKSASASSTSRLVSATKHAPIKPTRFTPEASSPAPVASTPCVCRAAVRVFSRPEQDLEELLAYYECRREHWKKLRTTHAIERLFVEVRRHIRALCAFTTPGSCERIPWSVFHRMNQHRRKHSLKAVTQNN